MRTILCFLWLLSPNMLFGQVETVFRGRPSIQISAAGEDRTVKNLSGVNIDTYTCVISKIGSEYYWASRENTPLTRIDGPAYTMFVATTGAGYVKVLQPEQRANASLFDPAAANYDYVEHILVGLGSITYYGRRLR